MAASDASGGVYGLSRGVRKAHRGQRGGDLVAARARRSTAAIWRSIRWPSPMSPARWPIRTDRAWRATSPASTAFRLRVTKGYDQQYKRSTYSMDVLYGFKTVYPELAVRALG